MRFPDEDAYDEAGAITRLWYRIICPFTFGARLWMVTTSILCALAVIQSANSSWATTQRPRHRIPLRELHQRCAPGLANRRGGRGPGPHRRYVARDGYLFLVGYHGSQRVAVSYDASHSARASYGTSTSTTNPACTGGTATSSSAIH